MSVLPEHIRTALPRRSLPSIHRDMRTAVSAAIHGTATYAVLPLHASLIRHPWHRDIPYLLYIKKALIKRAFCSQIMI